jgi:2-methylaconitate cis-trans-isomerase PrpF
MALPPSLKDTIERLKNNAGEAYDIFVNAFETHTAEVTATVIIASPSDVQNKQGQAQEATKLLRMFKEAK